jgi:hypothetical protein
LWVFKANDLTAGLAAGGIIGAAFTGAAAVALARDRRRAVLRLGGAIVVAGLLLGAVPPTAQWLVGRTVGDAQLAAAVQGALGRAMADLMSIGLWIAAYGVVAAAAAASMGEGYQRLTPRRAADSIGRWVQRRRQTTWGTVVLGVLAIFIALLVTQESAFWSRAAFFFAGLWLAYFGVTELLGLVRQGHPRNRGPGAVPFPTDHPCRGRRCRPGRRGDRRTALHHPARRPASRCGRQAAVQRRRVAL